MKEEIAVRALQIIEEQSGKLWRELEKGKELGWKDVKIILGGLGLLAGDKRIQEEAGKKNRIYKTALDLFAWAMRRGQNSAL